jgi:hypothetical protein
LRAQSPVPLREEKKNCYNRNNGVKLLLYLG